MNRTIEGLHEFLVRVQKNNKVPLVLPEALDTYVEKISANAEVLVWWSHGTVQGLIAFYCNDASEETAFLTMLAVDPTQTRKGIGKALLQSAITTVRARSFRIFRLKVYSENESAMALYKQFGFIAVGSDGTDIVMELKL
jgi:ribosomal protein S18 acetylase RimI-like enzyme